MASPHHLHTHIIKISILTCGLGYILSSQRICISPRYPEGFSRCPNEFMPKICNYRCDLLDDELQSINTSLKKYCYMSGELLEYGRSLKTISIWLMGRVNSWNYWATTRKSQQIVEKVPYWVSLNLNYA